MRGLRRLNDLAETHSPLLDLDANRLMGLTTVLSMNVAACDEVKELHRAIPTADLLKQLLAQADGTLEQLNQVAAVRLLTMRKIGVELINRNLRGGGRKDGTSSHSTLRDPWVRAAGSTDRAVPADCVLVQKQVLKEAIGHVEVLSYLFSDPLIDWLAKETDQDNGKRCIGAAEVPRYFRELAEYLQKIKLGAGR